MTNELEMKEEMLSITGHDREGWTVDMNGFFICPCGHRIEDDGGCPEGCVSPMVEVGLI